MPAPRRVRWCRARRWWCRSTARFLYGAPGAGLTGKAELRLQAQRTPHSRASRDYLFGLVDENSPPT